MSRNTECAHYFAQLECQSASDLSFTYDDQKKDSSARVWPTVLRDPSAFRQTERAPVLFCASTYGMVRISFVLGLALVGTVESSAFADVTHTTARPSFDGVPWLGVNMAPAPADLGVRIDHVFRGSPAERSGLRPGDRIVAVDGVSVSRPPEVSRAVQSHATGDTLTLNVEREGRDLTTRIVLSERPSGDHVLRMDLVGAPAAPWRGVTPLAGAPPSLESLRGRVVLLDFWASWCGPCQMLAPRLTMLKDRFGAQGLTVVGLTSDEPDRALAFAESHAMRYPIVIDAEGQTAQAYGVTSLPTLVLIDKQGMVREVLVGFDPEGKRLQAEIERCLAEPAETRPVRPPMAPTAPKAPPLPSKPFPRPPSPR